MDLRGCLGTAVVSSYYSPKHALKLERGEYNPLDAERRLDFVFKCNYIYLIADTDSQRELWLNTIVRASVLPFQDITDEGAEAEEGAVTLAVPEWDFGKETGDLKHKGELSEGEGIFGSLEREKELTKQERGTPEEACYPLCTHIPYHCAVISGNIPKERKRHQTQRRAWLRVSRLD